MSQLADRLNAEPVVMRGYTSSELMMVLGGGFIVWGFVCGLLGWLLGNVRIGLGFSALCTLATLFLCSPVLKNLKRNRPTHYYQHMILITLDRAGVRRSGFMLRSGSWSLGRTL